MDIAEQQATHNKDFWLWLLSDNYMDAITVDQRFPCHKITSTLLL